MAATVKSITKRFALGSRLNQFCNREFEDLKKHIDEKSSVTTELEADNYLMTLRNSLMSSTIGELSLRLFVAELYLRESNIEVNGIFERRSENVCNVA